jgi:hypothetical protein
MELRIRTRNTASRDGGVIILAINSLQCNVDSGPREKKNDWLQRVEGVERL